GDFETGIHGAHLSIHLLAHDLRPTHLVGCPPGSACVVEADGAAGGGGGWIAGRRVGVKAEVNALVKRAARLTVHFSGHAKGRADIVADVVVPGEIVEARALAGPE